MIARKRLHLIVIALCLWLPLQTIAGQWLHCAQLEASLIQADNVNEQPSHLSCHDAPAKAQLDQSMSGADVSSSENIKSCKHCQFSCTWHSALVLREFIPPVFHFAMILTQYISPSPAQPLLATPQRPPRSFV